MSSQNVGLLGAQEPRIRLRPKGAVDFYDGDEAVELSSGYGLTPDHWQGAGVVRGWLARGKDGRLAAGRCGLAVPRQNGKNGAVETAQLHKLVVQRRKILHTAHEVKTARKAFLRLCSFFENERKFPELAELVESIRRTNGQEAIILTNGASIEFVARSRGSGRGFTVDDLFCDEAQEMTDEQLEALLPTIAAAPSGDPQIIFLGTPPPPESPGEVFARVRTSALEKSERLCWDEWSIPDGLPVVETMKDWKAHVYSTNPALGIRLALTTITDERDAMSPDGFCRERLGQWQIAGRKAKAIAFSEWSVLIGEKPENGRLAFGVKFTPDGSTVALAAGIRPDDGPIHVEAFRQANLSEGLQWIVDFLVKRADQTALIVIDGKAGAPALASALRDQGMSRRGLVLLPNLDQVVSAHSMFAEAVKSGGLSHLGQGPLDEQVRDAAKRIISKTSGAFGWEADKGETVALLDAVTYAFWGAKTARANPGESRGSQTARRAANRRGV